MQARYVLVGNSAASLAAIDWIRKFDGSGPILLINREKGVAYSRVALPYFVSGERSLESILIRQRPDYERLGVTLLEDAEVTTLDPAVRALSLADGRRVEYEKLLLATGSEVVVPPIGGLEQCPHHHLWTLEDAIGMKKAAETAKRAVVIGGGFIGMLAAEALRKRAMDLTIVEMADQLMPQLLDAEGGKIFERAVRDAGVDLRLGTQVSAVGANGKGVRVTLSVGGTIDTDLLVVAAGVRPNLGCVGNGVIEKGRGIRVNERMETSQPGIYAAGDVAESADFVSGVPTVHAIWPTAVDQGRIAGANMAGRPVAYPGSLGMNVVGLFKVTLAQVGRFREAAGDVIEVSGSGGGQHYRKVVIDPAGTMVGAMYLGDENGVAEMGVIHHAIKRREPWRQFVAYGERRGASYAAMLARAPKPLPPGTR